jgi:uncharacterized protein YuzE
MRISYSEDADVLYLTFSELRSGRATYIEKENGDILRVDPATGTVIGVTVQLFRYRLSRGEKIDIPEIGLIQFNQVMSSLLESRLIKAH